VRYAWVEQNGGSYPIEALCEAPGVSPSGSACWKCGGGRQMRLSDAQLLDLIRAIYAETLVLVDDSQWEAGRVAQGRRVLPFLEENGQYAGAAPDSDTAIQALDRMIADGARFVVFGWPGFWWLEHYAGFRYNLRNRFRCVLENERLIVFDLSHAGES
jgi:hypothetical protein